MQTRDYFLVICIGQTSSHFRGLWQKNISLGMLLHSTGLWITLTLNCHDITFSSFWCLPYTFCFTEFNRTQCNLAMWWFCVKSCIHINIHLFQWPQKPAIISSCLSFTENLLLPSPSLSRIYVYGCCFPWYSQATQFITRLPVWIYILLGLFRVAVNNPVFGFYT